VKEVVLEGTTHDEVATFAACVATVLEVSLADVPQPAGGDPVTDWTLSRWLGGLGLGLVPVADAPTFSWAGPWLARIQPPTTGVRNWVVMYGAPSGVAWDPSGVTKEDGWVLTGGAVIAPGDVALALALPGRTPPPATTGAIEGIFIAAAAGEPARQVESAVALVGLGLDGDRHVAATGTFPSGIPGSALTLIEAEVCESFSPTLSANEHRRNLVTRGIRLNALVGREFMVARVRCRGVRLCEPCRVITGYAGRPILRALVHRGGLRADILDGGTIRVGDEIAAIPD
jgi:hypothetical protein